MLTLAFFAAVIALSPATAVGNAAAYYYKQEWGDCSQRKHKQLLLPASHGTRLVCHTSFYILLRVRMTRALACGTAFNNYM